MEKTFRFYQRFIFLYSIFVVVFFAFGAVIKDIHAFFVLTFVLAPLGLFISFLFPLVRRLLLRKRSRDFSSIIIQSAESLEADTPDIAQFDAELTGGLVRFFSESTSRQLFTTSRFLDVVNNIILSEWNRRILLETTDEFIPPLKMMAIHLREIASAQEENDPVRVLGGIGDLLNKFYEFKELNSWSENKKESKEFIQSCDEISMYLKQNELNIVEKKISDLFESLAHSTSDENFRWHIVIYLWLRIKYYSKFLIKYKSKSSLPNWWIKPERLLAIQLNMLTSSLASKDYYAITELIFESFDSNIRVPTILGKN